MKKIYYLLLLLILPTLSQAQQLPIDPDIRQGKLSNGMTYFIQHNKNPEDRAVFYLPQKVGSMQEEDNQAGLAHFLEHMAFAGTKNFPDKIIDRLEKYGVKFGANINAYTGFDQTVYFLTGIPINNKELIDTCLYILHDWSGFISLRDEDIDKERKVIKEEWRTRSGAYSRMWDKELPVIFAGSKYADRMPIGKMEVVENFEYQVLKDYYKKWYRPDLQGIIIVGDIDVNDIEQRIKTIFADIPKPVNPAERIYYPVNNNDAPIVSIVTDPEQTTTNINLYIKHDKAPVATRNTKQWLTQLHLQNMVTSMISQRLTEIGQKPDAPFSYAGVYYGDFFVAATKDAWTDYGMAKDGKLKETLANLVRENERAKRHGFTEGEIERAKANLLKGYETRFNNRNKRKNDEIVDDILQNFLIDGPITGIEYEYNMLKEILPQLKKQEFDNFVKKAVIDKNNVLTVKAPEKDKASLPTETELLAVMKSVRAEKIEPYIETLSQEPLVSNLPPAGTIVKEEKGKDFDETIWTLSNGMKVILKNTNFKDDEIAMTSIAPGGNSIFGDDETLNFRTAGEVIGIGGLGNFSPTDLHKVLAGKSVHTNSYINNYTQGIRGGTVKKDIETLFQLTYLNFTSPRKDEKLFKSYVEKEKNYLLNLKSNPNYIFHLVAMKAMYNDNPRVRSFEVEELDNLNYDRILEMYKECFANPGTFTFTFVGTIDEEAMKPLVERYLACLPSGNKNAAYKEVSTKIQKGKINNTFTQTMETPKATSLTTYSADLKIDLKEGFAFKRDILKGVLDLVYYRTMRGDEGGTYGTGVGLNISHIPLGETKLQVNYTTDPKRIEEMNTIVHKELQRIVDEGPTQEDFDKAVENILKTRKEYMVMNGYWTATLEILYFYGEDENRDYINRIKAITPKDIQNLATEIVSQGNVIEVNMLPKE